MECPHCHAPLVERTGPHGAFWACAAYPKCRFTQRDAAQVRCPRCSDGKVVEKRSRGGRTFYACHRYPECAFTSAHPVVEEKCPQCSSPYLVRKTRGLECANVGCKWRKRST